MILAKNENKKMKELQDMVIIGNIFIMTLAQNQMKYIKLCKYNQTMILISQLFKISNLRKAKLTSSQKI